MFRGIVWVAPVQHRRHMMVGAPSESPQLARSSCTSLWTGTLQCHFVLLSFVADFHRTLPSPAGRRQTIESGEDVFRYLCLCATLEITDL